MPSEMLDWKSIYEFGMQGKSFNYSQVMEFVKDNIGTFVSVSLRGKDLRKHSSMYENLFEDLESLNFEIKMKLNNYIYKNNIWMDIIW